MGRNSDTGAGWRCGDLGGIEKVLAGRPGIVGGRGPAITAVSTAGEDESELWRHRTEPAPISLADALDDLDEQAAAEDVADAAIDAARAPISPRSVGKAQDHGSHRSTS
ncbi:hypothetical protein [Cumulibacter soli]|uniref:hypothetical protein n=1 Tax=Cumulibacter soli TaxID=2546344 RepID=UPI001067B839|nr:hypothetical protein [Cumulibacter soli]